MKKQRNFKKFLSPGAVLIQYSLIICLSCHSQNKQEVPSKVHHLYNTTIVVNLKKLADRSYIAFTQLNPLHFQPVLVSPPLNMVDTSDILKNIIKLNISEPTYLALGFNIFYIEPNDSVNITYETLKHTKTHFKDTLTVNSGNIFFISPKYRSPKVSNYIDKIISLIKHSTTPDQIQKYLSPNNLINIVDSCSALAYKDFPQLSRNNLYNERLKTSYLNRLYWKILFELKLLYNNTINERQKKAIAESVITMINFACQGREKNLNAVTWGKYL